MSSDDRIDGSHGAPGSDQAITAGCSCPVMDNCHGRGNGYLDPGGNPLFWFDFACPMHGQATGIAPETMCYRDPNLTDLDV